MMTQEIKTKQISKEDAIKELWRRGHLSFLLDSAQKQLYDLYYKSNHKTMVWLLSRRQGKTYTLCVLALEQCIKQKNSIVKFVSPTKIQVNNNVRPLFRKLLETCPEDLKPSFSNKDYIYYFPNGSEIQLAGSDGGHAEKLRGGDSHIAFVDEAGTCDDLHNVIKSILLPTTLITKGKIILASTPPKEPDHEFLNYIESAEAKGSLVKMTVKDNPRITKEQYEELIREVGGENTPEARRELFCEIIRSKDVCVIPEFTPELEKEIVKEWDKPPFYDSYESMDIGFKDLTAVLFAYFDFKEDKVIIEDEIIYKGEDLRLDIFVKEIQEKESQLWLNPLTNEVTRPLKRVSDINHIVTQEILKNSNYQVRFEIADKYDKDSAIHFLRMLLNSKKIIIHPRCKTLIRHLKNVKWDKAKVRTGQFARSVDDGHYDCVDALLYLVKAVQYNRNPYPSHYNLNTKDLYVRNPDKFYNTSQDDVLKKIFNIKRRR